MASRSNTSLAKLSLFLLFAIFLSSSKAYDRHQLKETNLTLYFQDFSSGPNATSAIVTGIPGRVWSFSSFGTIFVGDDPITAGPHMDLPQIARGQGIFTTSSLDGVNAHITYSIVFTNREYNGSTLEIQGRVFNLASAAETAVVGGTGKFRFATGFATFQTVSFDATLFYSVTQCNITVLHY
ncbi:dirigent protein 2-like [Rhododendron vialii]|uniref:dirigent protein 2-like n=1 Tax=Rhododendron vialii TaxID=182163 RepID=UPI00265E72A2|nr:dirigent protein 2-like [Rhododendron vialii]